MALKGGQKEVNYTGCKFSIRITEKEDKSWRVTGSNFASMKAQLLEEKPNTFQFDTTFDTKRENFTVFKSETTGQWEIGCLLYIETETKTNIEHGVRMFRDSLPYHLTSSFLKTSITSCKDLNCYV